MKSAQTAVSRRTFCGIVAGGVLAMETTMQASGAEENLKAPKVSGDWPLPRQNGQLTALQPLPGKMKKAPQIVAALDFPRGAGMLHPFASQPNGPIDRALSLADGKLLCHDLKGKRLWESHPTGLNYQSFVAVEDIDGDGELEIALMAGRPTAPLGAAVVLEAKTGKVRFRHDVEPMSYWWTMQVGNYLPQAIGKQVVVCEHAYPPDAKFGYIALFDVEKAGGPLRQRWRFDFDHYTCFPPLLTADVDGDGVNELCVETHSRMWVFDVLTGKVKQYLDWDVSPGNIRSYGLVRFQDLNHDGLPEFFCIANFSQHHEVLINEKGKFRKAWSHGWDDSVTTRTVATTWPDPPIADVDGDGKLEMVVSMYASDGKPHWMIRIYDAMTGVLKATALDHISTYLADIDGDGAAEILADRSTDSTQTTVEGVSLLKVQGDKCIPLWTQAGAQSYPIFPARRDTNTAIPLAENLSIQQSGKTHHLVWGKETKQITLQAFTPTPPPPGPDYSHLPTPFGVTIAPPLVGDVDGDGKNEIVHFHDGLVTLYRWKEDRSFAKLASFPSTAAPVLTDLDGDGVLELVIGTASATSDPVIHALRIGRQPETLWKVTLTPKERGGLPHGKPLLFQPGRFLGRSGSDLYVYVGTPSVRSLMLDGSNGGLVWERGKLPGLERYFAPTVNLSAVWDVNGDGKEDLVFTCPDYYCVASGPTGDLIHGPTSPTKIFQQPSLGLYTFPAILPHKQGDPTVCLVDGHYFQAAMTIHEKPFWHQLPIVGEAKAGAEGFLLNAEGRWLMGFGRQDGRFACLDVVTGKVCWEFPLAGSASGVSSCDINGDGVNEFVFGTSHGELYALADGGNKAKVVWKAQLPAGVGTPILADVNHDGASEILVALGDGRLCLLS